MPAPRIRRQNEWYPSLGSTTYGSGGLLSNDKYLLTEGPKTRSTTVYESSFSGGLQNALDSIGEDTRLVLDNGPYSGNWVVPLTSHITIDGNGTTLSRGDTSLELIDTTRTGSEFSDSTAASGTYTAGQSSIAVSSTSGFSSGDLIRIYDSNQVHPEMPHVNSGSDSGQGVFHVVESVDTGTNELFLEEDLILDWDDPSGTLRVDNVSYGAVDQRLTGITFEGNDSAKSGNSRVVAFRRRKDLRVDNCTIRDGRNGLWIYESNGLRVDNVNFENLGSSAGSNTNYPLNISTGTHNCLITNCTSIGGERYAYKSGSGSWWPCRNGKFVNCYAADVTEGRRAFDQHPGSHYWDYIDCTVENGGSSRPRSYGWYEEGMECINPNQNVWYMRQTATDVQAERDHYWGDMGSYGIQAFVINDLDLVRFTDTWAEPNGSLNAFFRFRHDGTETLEVHELIVDHVAINGQWVDEAKFDADTSFSGSWSIPSANRTFITPSDGTTPSEYFGQKYGW